MAGPRPTRAGRRTGRRASPTNARTLPDEPGVYLFRDAKGRVIYVGKAKSIRKRVASHFSKPQPGGPGTRAAGDASSRSRRRRRHRGRGAARRAELHQAVPAALQHPPARRQVLSVHRDLARRGLSAGLFHARAPPPRAAPTSARFRTRNGCAHARGARQGLHVPLLHGPEPGRRSGNPCLDYYIKRCEAPCVGYVTREDTARASTA